MLPIYYVIVEREQGSPLAQQYSIWKVLSVHECDLADIDDFYVRFVEPFWIQGRNVQTFIFLREPPNPFPELAKQEKPGALPGD